MSEGLQERPRIMIVDDTPRNLQVLEQLLREQGYRVFALPSGERALTAVTTDRPHLILLDIVMPGMDGYEVCRRLKADPQFSAIPILFLSALSEPLDKLQAFGCGGVDYVTKPFQVEEVLARVATHLNLRRLRQELESHNAHLEEEVQRRTRQLAEAHARLSILDQAKGEFLELICQELRTPVHGVLGLVDLLLNECPPTPRHAELKAAQDESRARLLAIIDDALLLAHVRSGLESPVLEAVPLGLVLKAATHQTAPMARSRQVTLPAPPDSTAFVVGDLRLLVRALRALLETAVRFSLPNQTIHLSVATRDDQIELRIDATGRAIPEETLPRFFAVLAFGKVVCPGGDLGLDPPVAERILSLFGGRVSVANRDPAGIAFTVTLRTGST